MEIALLRGELGRQAAEGATMVINKVTVTFNLSPPLAYRFGLWPSNRRLGQVPAVKKASYSTCSADRAGVAGANAFVPPAEPENRRAVAARRGTTGL